MDLTTLEKQAIKIAMSGNWEKAVKVNQEILKLEPKNIAALNRLGRAYWETGKIKLARQTFKTVIKIDHFNSIAIKNLKRMKDSADFQPSTEKSPHLRSDFLEEPGKTKSIKLLRLAEPKILSDLDHGETVLLVPKKRNISVQRKSGAYLGILPDDLSKRLLHLIKGGNRYQAFVKAVDRHHLEIFIREVFRSHKFKNLSSFVQTKDSLNYIPYLSPESVHESKPEVSPTGEEDNES